MPSVPASERIYSVDAPRGTTGSSLPVLSRPHRSPHRFQRKPLDKRGQAQYPRHEKCVREDDEWWLRDRLGESVCQEDERDADHSQDDAVEARPEFAQTVESDLPRAPPRLPPNASNASAPRELTTSAGTEANAASANPRVGSSPTTRVQTARSVTPSAAPTTTSPR